MENPTGPETNRSEEAVATEQEIVTRNQASEGISVWLGGLLIILIVALLVLGGLILKALYIEKRPQTPQEAEIVRWEATLKENPNDPNAYLNLAWVYQQQGQLEKAEEVYRKALEADKNNVPVHYNLGVVYNRMGKPQKALEQWNFVVKRDKFHALAWYQIGLLYMEEKNYKKAASSFEMAVKGEYTYATIHYQLGLAYEKLGEKDKARKAFQEALKYSPDYEEAQAALKRLQ